MSDYYDQLGHQIAMIVVVAIVAFVGGAVAMGTIIEGRAQRDAIRAGVGVYCPIDGHFAFKGECDE